MNLVIIPGAMSLQVDASVILAGITLIGVIFVLSRVNWRLDRAPTQGDAGEI